MNSTWSRLLQPDDPRPVRPMSWRSMAPDDTPYQEGGTEGPQPERRVEQRIREAHAAGAREGEMAAQRRAEAAVQPVIERLVRSIEEIGALRARLRLEAEQDLVRLALAIARRILGRELALDPDALHGLVLAALEKLRSQEICRVRLHPAQEAAVRACLRQAGTDPAVEVIADPAREPGSVIFETERGSLDASVESQLQEIGRGLADRLRRHA